MGEPALCQTTKSDCHSLWHSPSFDGVLSIWFADYESQQQRQQLRSTHTATAEVSQRPGCPKGSVNKRKQHGNDMEIIDQGHFDVYLLPLLFCFISHVRNLV